MREQGKDVRRNCKRVYRDIKDKWLTELELENMFEERLPKRSRIEPKVGIHRLLNDGFLEIDDPMKTNCRFRLSEKKETAFI